MDVRGVPALLRLPGRGARALWNALPRPLLDSRPMRSLGRTIHRRVARFNRFQTHWTCFMRNRPLLGLAADLARTWPKGLAVRIASVGCSNGAELFSLLFLLRAGPREVPFEATGVDVSTEIIDRARRGLFRPGTVELGPLDEAEIRAIFAPRDDWLEVRESIRADVRWIVGDARDRKFVDEIGRQHLVLANNFIGPMREDEARACLENLAAAVEPGGYLVLEGVDEDQKARFARGSGLTPVLARLEEIRVADATKRGWPWARATNEPVDRRRPDWEARYTSVFQVPGPAGAARWGPSPPEPVRRAG